MFDLDSVHNELAFTSYIREFHVVEKHLLFNELAKTSFTDFHRSKCSVYMIVRTKRVDFIPKSFFQVGNFCFQGEVVVGNRREKVVFNIAKLLFETSGVTDKHIGWQEWAAKVMSLWRIDALPNASPSEKYRALSGIDLSLSSNDYLYINCALMSSVQNGNKDARTVVTPIQLGNMFDWNLFEDIEVLYVGKSTDGVLKRASGHNKWGKITNDLGSDEVALVYFMDVAQSSYAKATLGSVTTIGGIPDPSLDRDAVAVITEAALIKHFFDEKKYNEKVVDQDFQEIGKVKEKLRARGYTAVRVEIMLDGVMGHMGTKKTGFRNDHTFRHSLDHL